MRSRLNPHLIGVCRDSARTRAIHLHTYRAFLEAGSAEAIGFGAKSATVLSGRLPDQLNLDTIDGDTHLGLDLADHALGKIFQQLATQFGGHIANLAGFAAADMQVVRGVCIISDRAAGGGEFPAEADFAERLERVVHRCQGDMAVAVGAHHMKEFISGGVRLRRAKRLIQHDALPGATQATLNKLALDRIHEESTTPQTTVTMLIIRSRWHSDHTGIRTRFRLSSSLHRVFAILPAYMAITVLNEHTHPDLLNPRSLADRVVAVLGYGNQGAAHAQNLRDSGVSVVVANRADSENGKRATADGFTPVSIPEAVGAGDLIIMALPDETHRRVFEESIAPGLTRDKTLGFLHGYSVRFGHVVAPEGVGVVMVAPKGPGTLVRSLFVEGRGLPCLFAVEQENGSNNAESLGLAWAAAVGCGRAGVIRTTFATEAESDLFGEQAVLCGGVMALVLAAFEIMIENGYPPEIAYIECCHELKQVVDLLYARGPCGMNAAISNTAEFGEYETIAQLDDDHLHGHMRTILERIRNGAFAERMAVDVSAGSAGMNAARERLADHPIEEAGRAVRALMPWLTEPKSH